MAAITIASVHDGKDVARAFHASMLNLVLHDMNHEQHVGRFADVLCPSGQLPVSRNGLVRTWLRDWPTEWLLWLDTDHGFPPDLADRLLAVADPVTRPMVGALYLGSRSVGEVMGGYRRVIFPVLMRWSDEPRGFAVWHEYPRDQLTECAGLGMGATLIHRSVFERLRERNGGGEWSDWYSPVPNPAGVGDDLSEDLSLCYRMREAGIPVHVDTRVKISHMKPVWIEEQDYLSQLAGTAPPRVEPATERVAVLVPVMRRPHNAEPFMASLRASTGLATAYAIADAEDVETIEAWRAAGAEVLVDDLVTFPRKINLGYAKTSEPWVLLAGDDIAFGPGWLDQALDVARRTGAHVIGTNDETDDRVIAGEHATHPLIRRAYVDELGASWDGPGVVCHEGYRHWYVDNEIVTVAKERGTWAPAQWSSVPHGRSLNPAEWDAVTRIGLDNRDADRARFNARLAELGG